MAVPYIPFIYHSRQVRPGVALRDMGPSDNERRHGEYRAHCRALCTWLRKNQLGGYEYKADPEHAWKHYGGIARPDPTSKLPDIDLIGYAQEHLGRVAQDDIVRVTGEATYFDLRNEASCKELLATIRVLAGLTTDEEAQQWSLPNGEIDWDAWRRVYTN